MSDLKPSRLYAFLLSYIQADAHPCFPLLTSYRKRKATIVGVLAIDPSMLLPNASVSRTESFGNDSYSLCHCSGGFTIHFL
jgi:hypothetical protein